MASFLAQIREYKWSLTPLWQLFVCAVCLVCFAKVNRLISQGIKNGNGQVVSRSSADTA